MGDNHTDISFERMLIIAAILLILFFAAMQDGTTPNSAPTYANGSYNVYNETHTTNVDICGVCINTDR